MVTGKLVNWEKERILCLRTHLADGKSPEGIKFSVSMNIDNKALFVEFPNSWVVEYKTIDLVTEAFKT